ncbi:MAG: biopolymer transporter ExbD [Bacteriovoracaceae bacterium]
MATKMNNSDDQEEVVADINMTPLIDVMLVLLIIFMVTSSISLESGLKVDLPKTNTKTESEQGNVVIVSLNDHGELSVQGEKVTTEGLKEKIAIALKDSKSSTVILEGDQKASLGRAIEIMDLAKAAGAEKFAIATENKK